VQGAPVIDPARWVLAEAWLGLGLRLKAMPSWTLREIERPQLMRDEELGTDYIYDGDGVWLVNLPTTTIAGYTNPYAPQMGGDAMKHELAHYLIATEDQRRQRNFGLRADSDRDDEERALQVERVIDAMINGCGRIVHTALGAAGSRR
jgi:hypothetical protein